MEEDRILTCNVILNLLDRFLPKIRFLGKEENLTQIFPPSFSQKLQTKTFEEEADLSIIIGTEISDCKNNLYIASSGWSIYLSYKEPCNWKKFTNNSLSAIYVAALTVGEIFKIIIKDYVSVDISEEFIYDFITHGKDEQPVNIPTLPSNLDVNMTLIGCGGVGQAIAFALNQFRLRGNIILIDPDIIDESNRQRYLLAFDETVGAQKTIYLSQFLINKNKLLTILEILWNYETAISIFDSLFNMEDVIISVDNKRTRINLQAALPKTIWNIWTDTGEKTLRYGIGRHNFLDQYQCLACTYFPEGDVPNQMELNASLLGISQEEINNRTEKNDLITKEDLYFFLKNFDFNPDQINKIKNLIGQPFSNIFHGECGVFSFKPGEKHESTTAPHIPVLAGTYGVIQYVLSKITNPNRKKIISIGEFNAFNYPAECFLIKKKRHTKCICNDPIYQKVFKEKWGL
ncbi:MAG: ThiF family adenylyltransferase [Candidatus Hermodarchaeota archaeon]